MTPRTHEWTHEGMPDHQSTQTQMRKSGEQDRLRRLVCLTTAA